MIALVIMGMGMGLAFAAPPGAVTAETLRRGARGGFRPALSVQLGSLIGDATYASLAFLGLAALLQSSSAQLLVGTLGACLLLYFAWQSLRTAPVLVVAAGNEREQRAAFLSGMLLSLTNPWAVAFWVSLGGTFVGLGARGANEVGVLLVSFMGGSLVWALLLAAMIGSGRRRLSPRLFRLVSIVCGLMLGSAALGVAARVLAMLFI